MTLLNGIIYQIKLLKLVASSLLTKMELFSTPHNIFELFYPLQLLLRAFGLFPKSFNGAVKNGNFIFRVRDKFWLALVMLFYAFFGVVSIWHSDSHTPRSAKLLQRAWMINGIVSLFVVVLNALYGARKTENFRMFLEMCCNFDLKVSINLKEKYYILFD